MLVLSHQNRQISEWMAHPHVQTDVTLGNSAFEHACHLRISLEPHNKYQLCPYTELIGRSDGSERGFV
jgi:hypothetical protein